jgi:hypothetical protein
MDRARDRLSKVGERAFVVMVFVAACVGATSTPDDLDDAAQQVDWDTVRCAPIPAQIRAEPSEDPLKAGFPRQWIEHCIYKLHPGWGRMALRIASEPRSSDNVAAAEMERQLRAIVQKTISPGDTYRVFCNALGCLTYVERPHDFGLLKSPVEKALANDHSLAVGAYARPGRPVPWDFTVVIRRPPSQDHRTDASKGENDPATATHESK